MFAFVTAGGGGIGVRVELAVVRSLDVPRWVEKTQKRLRDLLCMPDSNAVPGATTIDRFTVPSAESGNNDNRPPHAR